MSQKAWHQKAPVQEKEVKWHVDYTENCTPSRKSFGSYVEALEFVANLYIANYDNRDTWVNYIFKGTILVG